MDLEEEPVIFLIKVLFYGVASTAGIQKRKQGRLKEDLPKHTENFNFHIKGMVLTGEAPTEIFKNLLKQ